MTEKSDQKYCLAVRHDMATTVFLVRAADDAAAVLEANRIVTQFAGSTDVPAELRRADDSKEWRSAAAFQTHLQTFRDRTGSIVPI